MSVHVPETCTENASPVCIYVQFAETGTHCIRKWSREPFEGGLPYGLNNEDGAILNALRETLREYCSHKIDALEVIDWFTEHLGMSEGGPFAPYPSIYAKLDREAAE